MLSHQTLLALGLTFAHLTAGQSPVQGSAPGFAAGVTGGGDAAPVYPDNIEDLKTFLTSSEPQNIVISGTFDFRGSEGTESYEACNNYECTPENGGQAILNTLGACTDGTYNVDIDVAGYQGIEVASDKTLVGQGTDALMLGKGLRIVGVSNVIVQNIAITDLNPKYVWGGDAITISGAESVWIDHVTTARLGRQHYSFGQDASHYVTLSNNFINGETPYSATCDSHTYWNFEMVGEDDTITLYHSYVYMTSGRAPAVSGNTLLHAVNNVFADNSGHLIEGGGSGLFEGNVFTDITTTVSSGFTGQIFGATTSNKGYCASALGRDCVENTFDNAPYLDQQDTGFLSEFSGLTIVPAHIAIYVQSYVVNGAGNTLSA